MARKFQYKICPYCGGTLDSGEKCDCRTMNGRDYSSIEVAGYKITRIELVEHKEKSKPVA